MLLLSFLPMNLMTVCWNFLKNIRDKENQMFDIIILVDDGSGADFAPLFAIAQVTMHVICKDMMIIKEKVVL